MSTLEALHYKVWKCLLHIIFPPVYGTGGPSRVWGITSPPYDRHQSPKEAIDPGPQNHADVSVGGHSSSYEQTYEILASFSHNEIHISTLTDYSKLFSSRLFIEHFSSLKAYHTDKRIIGRIRREKHFPDLRKQHLQRPLSGKGVARTPKWEGPTQS